MNELYLCTLHEERHSRCEYTTSLVFDTRSKVFKIRTSQDYETQAKIHHAYQDVKSYLAEHPEHRDTVRDAIATYTEKNPEHETAMKTALTRMNLT